MHPATENTSAQRRIVTDYSWEKSVASLLLMFCQRQNGYDLFKVWIHFLVVVCYARGTRMTHLSSETTFLCSEFFFFFFFCQNEASALFSCCLVAGVMSQSTWEGCRPGKHGVWKWRQPVLMDALSSLYRA